MPKILENINTVSNFLSREQWRDKNFCRKDVTVLADTAGAKNMEVGAVLYQNDKAGNYLELADAFDPALDNIAILVDERVGDDVILTDSGPSAKAWGTAGTTASLAVLVKGDAIVRKGGLFFGAAGATAINNAVTSLEAAGIKVIDSFQGQYQAKPLSR
tara:strand:+ start:1144 stop:1620 length:477 start_codon:yes stop_codon:yes gene_type:complete